MLHIDDFLNSLPIMGKGMFGIFFVTLIIIGVTMLLNKLTQEKNDVEDIDD